MDPRKSRTGRRRPLRADDCSRVLTLSLARVLAAKIYRVDNVASVVNYGADSARFPLARSRRESYPRGGDPDTRQGGSWGMRAHMRLVVELEGSTKPACVVDVIYLMTPA